MIAGLFQGLGDQRHEIFSVADKRPTENEATLIALNGGFPEPYTFQREERPNHPQFQNLLLLLAADGGTLILVGN
jgi:hypothetical protein